MHVEELPSASEVELLAPEPRSRPRRWAAVLPLLVAAAGLALVVALFGAPRARRTAVAVRGAEVLQEEGQSDGEGSGDGKGAPACGSPGGACLDSGCCVDGGESGYQCYKKTDGWAECAGTCEEGQVTDGETDGTYDQWGTFKPTAWSCKKVGKRSKKGCTFLNETECDKDRCVWSQPPDARSACLPICGQMPDEGACGSQAHCMWYDGVCKPGCGSEDTCPTDRCVEQEPGRVDTCIRACWTYRSQDECPMAQGCIFEGVECKADPCSSPDESCLETKCCSQQRGAGGMTCFSKDKNYAQCKRSCWEDGWGCEELGNRTKLAAGCSWPGQDCRQTRLCCQEGFACAVKDEMFTGCTQTEEKHTWDSKSIPIPSDWDGTVLGGSRAEYSVPPAGDGEEKMGDVLFCFMAYLPDSAEVGLMNLAKELNASIFACDSHSVYESWGSGSAGWDTGESTITNTDVFLNVWQQVRDEGKWLAADWTVKVDPDAVLVAERLKWHIGALNAPAYRPIYLKNNGMDPGLGNNGFLGAIEVFSNAAVEIYFDNWEGCRDAYGLNTGEDGFFKGCMDSLGVGYMLDANIFKPDFSPGGCANGDMVGFHPLKEWSQWRCCWDIILGKNRKVDFGKCDMGEDGMGPAEEPPDYVMPGKR
ncbi:unnamed protein product [Prorocentrum cordatum]|uniref:Uncharacterized protein n=1 Tax=Prorocentrum cordatum TaxID=2364126 RepID=A0ABN9S3C1_9DINO|nr:unnamed protein product [Polarella glacialis]